MTIIYVLFLFSLIFFNITFTNNEDYLSKENTSIIKGICILWIILSHSTSYVGYSMFLDRIFYKINSYTGQLIVVMFLFYSGYGVVYSFYHKRNYLDSFIKNRIINTLFNFDIAIILFLIISIIYEGFPSISKIILSFIGWDSFGNSNWYIFDILILYFISYIVLKLKNYKFSIVLSWIFCIMFVLTMYRLKPSWWYNTILAYPLGMTFYYCKEKVEKISSFILRFYCYYWFGFQ